MTNQQRNSNLELYRIITMLAIVAHHYVVNSGLMGGAISCDDFNTRNVFFLIFGMWGKTGINCFVLITGYFMCTSQITLRKFLKLMLQISFKYRSKTYLNEVYRGHSVLYCTTLQSCKQN